MQHSRIPLLLVLLVGLLAYAGCGSDQETELPDVQPIFGDGVLDNTRVLARVDGYAITEKMLDLRFEELSREEQVRFQGPEGRRVFLRTMVDEALRVREAEARRLHREPRVARVLIAQRRAALDLAQRADLTKDREPTIDEVRAYFARNRDNYMRLGTMHASHVECLTREAADEVYRLLTVERAPLPTVVAHHSQNNDTKLRNGDLGWFNRSGYIAGVLESRTFTERVWDFEVGTNPPLRFRDRWHVVVVHERTHDRQQTLEEAYNLVVQDMLPDFHKTIVEDWLRTARVAADVEYFGEYRPGQGRTPQELIERAYYAGDPQTKLDLLGLLADDFPESEQAPTALFMAANVVLDTWGDRRQAAFFLNELLRRYPATELRDDATYILENMDRPDFLQPRSIEDLRPRR